jgi:sugar/nucleoside kinase (ribokinase family)
MRANYDGMSGSSTRQRKPRFDVVAIGDINADLILSGDVVPTFGQVDKLIRDADLCIGSSAAIFACGAARLGLKTAIVGKVGRDLFGEFMTDSLHTRGIDTSGVVVDQKIRTGLTVILSKGQDRATLTHPGTIPALKFSEIDFSVVHSARHLHLSSFFLLDSLRPEIPRLCREARQTGLTVSMDTNYDPAEKWDDGLHEALRHVDIFLPNAVEAKAIARQELVENALEILAENIPLVAVKLGEQGAMAKQGTAPGIVLGAQKVDVVDTVGAGDSFDAGLLFGFLKGWELKESLELALACGSLSTRRPGGTDAQPDLDEAMRFIRARRDQEERV